MYELQLAVIFCSVALFVCVVLWYQFHPKVAEDVVYEPLQAMLKATMEMNYPPSAFTCFNCSFTESCPVAWDLYNLDDDCLYIK